MPSTARGWRPAVLLHDCGQPQQGSRHKVGRQHDDVRKALHVEVDQCQSDADRPEVEECRQVGVRADPPRQQGEDAAVPSSTRGSGR